MSESVSVIATDDHAAFAKASCVKKGYWKDDALLKLIPKGPKLE